MKVKVNFNYGNSIPSPRGRVNAGFSSANSKQLRCV
jgi:hypothetical protein